MPSADNVTFSSVAERIRTLTTMLQGMGTRASPTSEKTEVPLFLRHLVALFTCNDTFDNEAKAIAVTGSITIEGVRILVVTQNPFNMSPPSELRVEVVAKGDKTFQQVVGEYDSEVTLKEHISDLCAILANYNSHSGDRVKQFSDFCLFVVDRSFRKLSSRVFQDEQSWKVNLVQRIYYWTPGECELDDIQWINRPMWASSQAMFPDGMRQRTLDGSGGQVQWELSNTTVKAWAQFLARVLGHVKRSVKKANDAKEAERSKPAGEKRPEKVASALRDVHAFCHLLYRFINWEANVVQILLTKTSLAYRLGLESPTDDNVASDDMGREPTESRGQQVLQYLQSIVAWHAAIMSLYDRTLSLRVPENLDIGLVEVPRCSVKVMSKDDINAEFFRRYPASSLAARATIGDSLPDLCPFRFTGTVHAETTLMGLLSYFAEGSDRVKYDVQIQNEAVLEEIIGPATFERAIAVSNNCCWCCNWLGNKLTDINLPASHGVIYAWSPPLVGVDIAVLRDLEDILWRKLASALRNASQTRSRRSVHYNTVACRLR